LQANYDRDRRFYFRRQQQMAGYERIRFRGEMKADLFVFAHTGTRLNLEIQRQSSRSDAKQIPQFFPHCVLPVLYWLMSGHGLLKGQFTWRGVQQRDMAGFRGI
jgi:hypothetical protein